MRDRASLYPRDEAEPGCTTRETRPLRTLARGLAILECFSAQRPCLSHSEIVAAMGLPSGTIARFLQTLEALGYVAQTDAKRYRLTVRALALTQGSLSALWLPEWIFPRLERLALETGEAWTLCVLDDCQAVCVSFGGGSILHGVMPLGIRTPAHRTAVGTAIIAFSDPTNRELILRELARNYADLDVATYRACLAETAARGFVARQNSTGEQRLAGAAAPVWDCSQLPVAAVGIVAPIGRQDARSLARRFGSKVMDTAEEISTELGYSRPARLADGVLR